MTDSVVSLIEGGLTVPFLRFILGAALNKGFFLLNNLFETRLPLSLLLLVPLLRDEVLIDLPLSGESPLMHFWHLFML